MDRVSFLSLANPGRLNWMSHEMAAKIILRNLCLTAKSASCISKTFNTDFSDSFF
jgi:hypothetical protein